MEFLILIQMLISVEVMLSERAIFRFSLMIAFAVDVFKSIGHNFYYFISNLGRLVLKFALQH